MTKDNKLKQVALRVYQGDFGPTEARSGYCYVTAVFNYGPTDNKSEVFFSLGFDEGCEVVVGTIDEVLAYIKYQQGLAGLDCYSAYTDMAVEVQAAYTRSFGIGHKLPVL